MSTNWRRGLIALGASVVLFIGVWLVVAVIVPLVRDAECTGIEFHSQAQAQPPPTDRGERPPIGGTGGLAGQLRAALRGNGPAVYCDDFADPFVLRVGDAYYAYSTNTEESHIPVLTSSGLFGTASRSDALAETASWSSPGKVWAPAVLQRPGGFVLYYATAGRNLERECLSLAVAERPTGPFVDGSTGPLACPDGGGAIDPTPFVDADGRTYLLWKSYGGPDGIVARELAPDGLSFVGGEPQLLLQADEAWEGGLVEAPSMVAHEGRYYLFYSANDWATANYGIGYAVCDSPLGPCAKPGGGPWLASTDKAQGPGGQEVFTDEQGRLWMVLHAWVRGKVGYPDGARNLFVVPLEFVNGVPTAG
ncbi:MAG: glycoside hydrolase family 43 protein [Acidimicrobiia bacterium]